MKTAVEWLQSQIVFESVDKELLARWDEDSDLSEFFEQAKEMEKQQIVEHSVELTKILISNPFETSGKTPTELMDNYFKETFKQQEQ
jgi:hypothetical protein